MLTFTSRSRCLVILTGLVGAVVTAAAAQQRASPPDFSSNPVAKFQG